MIRVVTGEQLRHQTGKQLEAWDWFRDEPYSFWRAIGSWRYLPGGFLWALKRGYWGWFLDCLGSPFLTPILFWSRNRRA